jgi:hypothetical protein
LDSREEVDVLAGAPKYVTLVIDAILHKEHRRLMRPVKPRRHGAAPRAAAVVVSALLTLAFSACLADAQTSASSKLIGVWRAQEKTAGQPRVVMTIKPDGADIAGSAVFRGLTKDGDNDVTLDLPLINPDYYEGTLSFRLKLPDDSVSEWEMKISTSGEGDLRLVKDNDSSVDNGPRFHMNKTKD